MMSQLTNESNSTHYQGKHLGDTLHIDVIQVFKQYKTQERIHAAKTERVNKELKRKKRWCKYKIVVPYVGERKPHVTELYRSK